MPGSPLLVRVRNRVERARQHRWRTAAYTSGSRHVVMGGAPRSGTTLLRKLLDRHPELCSGPETKLFVPAAFNLAWLASAYALPRPELDEMLQASGSQGAFIDAFAARVSAAAGKARWAEKTPQNIRYLDWILARFPAASVVHIVRDGRDVVCSDAGDDPAEAWGRVADARASSCRRVGQGVAAARLRGRRQRRFHGPLACRAQRR